MHGGIFMKKKWIKLFATLFVCATLALGFTGCEDEGNNSSSSNGTNTEQGSSSGSGDSSENNSGDDSSSSTPDSSSGDSSSEQTHTHNYTAVTTAPTCTEQGFTAYTCSCGDEYIGDYVNALNHEFTNYEFNNNATCEQDGTETAICSRLGCEETDTRTKEKSALNHDYGVVTYMWNKNQCTATRVCTHDNTHKETEAVTATYIKDTDATCTVPEKGHYIATFTNVVFEPQTTVSNSVENGAKLEHTHSTLKHSDTEHWYECVCGDKKGVEGHTPSAPATETTDQICTECERVLVPSLGHVHTLHLTKVNAKEQSCTETGNIEYYTCTCNKWFTDSTATTEIADKNSVVLEKDTHNYGEWIEEIPTVCGENGEKAHYHCSECEQNFDSNYNKIEDLVILATEEHEYGEWITVQSGGCSAVSYRVKICYKCAHYVLDADVDVDLVHPHEFELIEKAATCTEDGIEFQFKCKNCNFVAAEELIEALGHDLPEYEYFNAGNTHYQICKRCKDEIHERHTCYDWIRVKEPNCYETGLAEGVCLKCGLDIEKVLPIVHDWEFTKYETEPTCTENGVSLYTCSICSTTKTETAYKLGHNHQFNSVITAPTCTETGLDLYVCSRCGDEKEKTVSSLGHDWDDGIITIDPDCYKTGNKHYECEREGCDATKDEELAKKHTFNDGEIIIEPSCTINGKIKFTCQICKYSKELNLGVKHNTTYHAKVKATCTEDGNHEYWYCEDCNTYFSDVDSESCYFSYDGRNYYFDARIYSYQQSTLETLTITKTGHDIPDYFNEYDEENHWQECLNGCGLTQNANEHEFEETFVVEVQRVSGGYNHVILHHWECLHCEYFINGEMDDDGNITPNDGETILHEHGTYEPVAPTLPSCVTKGYTAGLICGECAEVLVAQVELPALGHNFVDAICTRCGLNSKLGTPGLKYTLNSDGVSYSCAGMGTATTSFIVIGSEYNGLPVTKISPSAFYEQYNLMSVVIPASIESIGSSAFYNCYKLVEIYNLSTNVTVNKDSGNGYIGNYALDIYNDIDVKSKLVKLSNGYVFYLGVETNYLIGYTGAETELKLPNIFAGKGYEIYNYAFYCNEKVDSVTIGLKTQSIGRFAFSDCVSIENIYYNAIECADCESNSGVISGNIFHKAGQRVGGIKLIIGKNVKVIPANLFATIDINERSWCPKIVSVDFEENSLCENIGHAAFYGCYSLKSIEIPNSITEIDSRAFSNCESLTEVYITDIEAWYNISFQYGYNYEANPLCNGANLYLNNELLTTLEIPNGIKEIRTCAFVGCDSLTKVIIPNSVVSIGYGAFAGCSALTIYCEVESKPGGWNSNWISSGCPVVWNCKNNDVADDCYSYTEIEGVRYSLKASVATVVKQSKNITIANIPSSITYKGTTYAVTGIGDGAFDNCFSLEAIIIPTSVTSIGEDAFYDCNLLTIYCEAESKASGWDSNWNYSNRPVVWNYKNNDIADDGYIHTVIDGVGYGIKDGEATLVRQPINITTTNISSIINYKGTTYSVTSIGEYAFYNCSSLTSVVIPNSVKSIGEYAFSGCDSLINVEISNSVTSIGEYVFYNCYSLTNIEIPSSVTSIGQKAFYHCDSLIIYCEVKSKPSGWKGAWNYSSRPVVWNYKNNDVANDGFIYTTIGDARYGIKDDVATLVSKQMNITANISTRITYKGTTYVVTSIGNSAFYNWDSLTSVVIPDSVTSIGERAFYNCSSLTSVVIPNSVKSIGKMAFEECRELNYNIKDGLKYLGNEQNKYLYLVETESRSITAAIIDGNCRVIGSSAFEFCDSLTSVVIPDSVTSIGNSAFSGCSSLTSILIPDSVTSIDGFAFSNCSSLTIYCETESVPSGWNSNWNNSNCPVIWGKDWAIQE